MQLPTPTDGEIPISVLHQGLVDQVKAKGHITSPLVEAAFRAVPRHLFLPNLSPQEVYQDKAITTKSVDGQFVSSSSQPTIMAIMLEQLDLQPGQRVLEIGAGTGYNAALMAHIVGETGHIVTIDIDEDIVEGACEHLATAGFERVQVVCTDGGLGFPDEAPYDRIILTVNSGDITPAWREQLKPGGRLLLPLVVRGPQVAVAFKQVEDYLESISVQPCGFVGLRGAFAESNASVQLVPEPGRLYLRLGEARRVNADRVVALLKGMGRDIPTQVYVTPQEIYSGLSFWLALHEPLFCELTASGEMAQSGIVPNLFGYPSTIPMSSTIALLEENSLSLILFASGQAPSPNAPTGLFQLAVRSYGPSDALASHLVAQMMAWNAAGRPNERSLHIRAYVQNSEYVPDKYDIVIEKHWTRFVFRWMGI